MGNSIGAAIGLVGGAVATGLAINQFRRKQAESAALEAWNRKIAQDAIGKALNEGKFNPDEPGMMKVLEKSYGDKDIAAGIAQIARTMYQENEGQRQANRSLTGPEILPEGPTVPLGDFPPDEAGAIMQHRAETNPMVAGMANKAFAPLAQQQMANVTSSQNTQTTVGGAKDRAVYNAGQAWSRQEDQQAHAAGLQEDQQAETRSNNTIGYKEAAEAVRLKAIRDVVAENSKRLPPNTVNIPMIADAVANGNFTEEMQAMFPPDEGIALRRASEQAKLLADFNKNIDMGKAFRDIQGAVATAKRSKKPLSDEEMTAMVEGSRADMLRQITNGIRTLPGIPASQVFTQSVLAMPMQYESEILSGAQVLAKASEGDDYAQAVFENAQAEVTKTFKQAGIPESDFGSPPTAAEQINEYGETPDQAMARAIAGLPPPAPAAAMSVDKNQSDAQTPSPASTGGASGQAAVPTPAKPAPLVGKRVPGKVYKRGGGITKTEPDELPKKARPRQSGVVKGSTKQLMGRSR